MRVAVIWNNSIAASAGYLAETRTAARSMGVDLQSVEVRNATNLDLALEAVAAARPSAFLTLSNGMFLANRTRIVEFTARSRLPAIFPDREFAQAGGLMA